MDKKRVLGQFFTKHELWLKPQVVEFIRNTNATIAYDPFAGHGDLLKAVQDKCGFSEIIGLDIDNKLIWKHNDSLLNIPHLDNAVIITNPPYISNYSATRRGVSKKLEKYFANSKYSDLYLIALDQMLAAQKNVVAIIPETFINSNYDQKNLLHSISILEENPFDDTENPVIVACFDGEYKNLSEIKIYKNDVFVNSLGNIENLRLKFSGSLKMNFNVQNAWLAVRCVDSTSPSNRIKFDFKHNIKYDWENKIKASSRLFTLIDIQTKINDKERFIAKCNEILCNIRNETQDIVLSPFKGNMKNGIRRRRLDFATCRAIIEKAYYELFQAT